MLTDAKVIDRPCTTVTGFGGGRVAVAGHHRAGRLFLRAPGQGERPVDIDAPSYAINGSRSPNPLDAPAPTVTGGGTEGGGGPEPFGYRVTRENLMAAMAAASRLDEPAPTVKVSGNDESVDRARASRRPFAILNTQVRLEEARLADRPATTVDTRDVLPQAGRNGRAGHSQRKGAVRLSVAQLAALQSFPPGFAFVGNKTSQHRQVGNAVPALLGEAMGRAVVRVIRNSIVEAAE